MLNIMKNGIKTIIENMEMSPEDRTKTTQEWLKTEYGAKEIKDPSFAANLSLIHDHDDLPLHFGAIKIGTAFSALYVRLVQSPHGWHIATSKTPEGGKVKILHPKNDPAYNNPDNIIGIQELLKLLKTGTVTDDGMHVGMKQQNEEIIVLPEDSNTQDEDVLTDAITTDNTNLKTTSVSIDMSKFLTGE